MSKTESINVTLPSDLAEEFREAKLSESPSSIVSFRGCPMKWYLERYSGLPRSPSNYAASMGSFIHRILESFYNELPQYRTEKILKKTWVDAFNQVVDEKPGENGLVDEGLLKDILSALNEAAKEKDFSEDSYFEKFEKESWEFTKNIYNFDENPKTLDVVSNESWIHFYVNGIRILGRVDRTIRKADGSIHIQDYKTGKKPWDRAIHDFSYSTFTPCGIYSLASSMPEKHKMEAVDDPEIDPSKVQGVDLLYLKENMEYSFEVNSEELQKVSNIVHETTESMKTHQETGVIPANKSAKPDWGDCRFCPLSGKCPAWTGNNSAMIDAIELGRKAKEV